MAEDLPPRDVIRAIERVEAEMMIDMTRAAPRTDRDDLEINMHRIGTAYAFLMDQIDWVFYNRLLCLGIDEPATEETADCVADLYRRTSMLFAVQISPTAEPCDLIQWLRTRGIVREAYAPWVKFYRDLSPPAEISTDFRVIRVETDDQAFTWAGTAAVACHTRRMCLYWTYKLVGRPGWHHYLAYDGDQPVACGALYVKDQVGWLGFGGTFPSSQRRGAQNAIIARRIHDAADLGCRLLTSETKPDTPSWPSPSYRNMLRAGFKVAYKRHNFRLKATSYQREPGERL